MQQLLQTDVVSYGAILSCCHKAAQWEQALALFEAMPLSKAVVSILKF